MTEYVLLKAVIDIKPDDPVVIELNNLAYEYGLFDMTEVLVSVLEMYEQDGSQVAFLINETNYRDVVKTMLGVAVFNYATVIHENFAVLAPNHGAGIGPSDLKAATFSRKISVEEHKAVAMNFLKQARMVIEKQSGRIDE